MQWNGILSEQEVADIKRAIREAQDELCLDPFNPSRFPQAYAYDQRLEAILKRFE